MVELSIGVVNPAEINKKMNDLISAMYSGTKECPICGGRLPENYVYTNRDWLCSLSTAELVDWIKNTASAMSDAELMRWMEEKHG